MITLHLTILLLVGVALAAEPNKKCDRNVVDTCSGTLLMLGDRSFVFPTTSDLINTRCRYVF